MSKPTPTDQTVCRNRKAAFRFEILEQFECGIVLVGTEVKSLREKLASLEEAYARIVNNEVWLMQFHIGFYRFSSAFQHESVRKRKLLLHSREIRKLKPKVEQKGLTLVPVRVYFNDRGIAKITLALCRGKTLSDKRESIKSREHRREMDRASRRSR
jgi:SsrA-binding protein